MAQAAPRKSMAMRLLPSSMAVVALSLTCIIAGVTEHPMTPFRSPIYVLAVLVTYLISVQRGTIDALFLSTGFVTLLLLGSAFRSQESLLAFGDELPLDLFLFYSVAILPGFIVSLYESAVTEIEGQKANGLRAVKSLSARLMELGQVKKRLDSSGQADDGKGTRRGTALSEALRSLVLAKDVDDAMAALGAALRTGVDPDHLFSAVARPRGYHIVLCSREDKEGGVIARDDSQILDIVQNGKGQLLKAVRTVGPSLDCNVLYPVMSNRSLIGLIGLDAPTINEQDDMEFIGMLVRVTEGVVSRLGLEARN